MVAYGIGSELSDEVPPASVSGARAKEDEAIDRHCEPSPHLCEGIRCVSAQERPGLAGVGERGGRGREALALCMCVCVSCHVCGAYVWAVAVVQVA